MGERIIRLIWTFVSAAGTVFAIINWRDAALDYRAVRALPDFRPDGPRAIAGQANVRRQQLRAATQGCFLAIGVATLTAPVPVPPRVRAATIVAMMMAQLVLVLNDLLDRNDRRKAIDAPPYRRRKTDREP